MGKVLPKKRSAPASKPAARTASTAVATRASEPAGALAKPNIAAMLAEDAGGGLANVKTEDMAVPRLAIVHELSAICNKQDPAYDETASAGMILENVSNTLYDGDEGILLVLVAYRRAHLEWYPRNSKAGQGFVRDHGVGGEILSACHKDEKTGAMMTPNGTEIVVTAEYFALLVDEATGSFEQVLVPMAKTQFSKSKKLLTMAQTLIAPESGKPAPLFYRAYRFSTVPESNDKGHWYGWKITASTNTLNLKNGEDIYMAARNFRRNIESGNVKVATPGEAETTGTGGAAAAENAPM